MNPKTNSISIIVPVHNSERYLHRCIDSLIAQTFKDFEIIIVNDGSTDNSGIICDEYAKKDERIHVVHCNNGGPSRARNIGLNHVQTTWVTFVDSDDYVTPEYISNFLKYNSLDIETQVIQGYYTIGHNGQDNDTLYPSTIYKFHIAEEGKRSTYIEKNNLLYNWAVWCKVFSIEIIRKNNIRFEDNIWCGEDGLFWHNYLCHIKKIIYIEEQGYYYFCPRDFDSTSRNNKHKLSTSSHIKLALNYKFISSVLPKKFKMGYKCTSFLRMYHIKHYFKAILESDILSKEQTNILKRIRPSIKHFVPSKKGVIFWILNLLPTKFVKKLVTKQ